MVVANLKNNNYITTTVKEGENDDNKRKHDYAGKSC